MTAPLDEICASCSRKPCTTLPNPRFMGCIGVLDNPHEAPHNCPLAITGQRQLSFALFGLNDMALRRLCDEATQSARVLFGSAPRSPGQAEAYLGQLMEEGRIRMLAINPGQAIPAHLVRSPAKPAPKKEVVEQVAEIIEEAPPPPPKEEKKVRTPIHIIEVPDLLFSLGSPVPALDDKGWLVGALATAVLYAKDEGAERQERLIVCGHADTTGEPPRNYEIAEQRAQMIKALLDQNVEAWKTLANKHGKVRDYQQTLKSLATTYGWSCDPGKVDNTKGPQTEAAVKAFQQECNDRYNMGLTVDGDVGPKTWTAIHRTLCALVCEHLDITGTAEPAPPKWLKPIYGFPAGQGVYSCGESFPVAAVGRNDIASEENRRVELVFAPTSLDVKAAPSKSVNMKAKDCVLYDGERVEHVGITIIPQTLTRKAYTLIYPINKTKEYLSTSNDESIVLQWLSGIFGKNVPNSIYLQIKDDILNDRAQMPECYVLPDEDPILSGHFGAYDESLQRIYLKSSLIQNSDNWNDLACVACEEFGHHMEWLIRSKLSEPYESPGDEGACYAWHLLIDNTSDDGQNVIGCMEEDSNKQHFNCQTLQKSIDKLLSPDDIVWDHQSRQFSYSGGLTLQDIIEDEMPGNELELREQWKGYAAGSCFTIVEWKRGSAQIKLQDVNGKIETLDAYMLKPYFHSKQTQLHYYEVGLNGQYAAVKKAYQDMKDFESIKDRYKSNPDGWREQYLMLQKIYHRKSLTYADKLVREVMYNRFDKSIKDWTDYYNRALNPKEDLDPNVIKSMAFQEGRMGTSGQYFLLPPYSWIFQASTPAHPIMSRYNLLQALDSGLQQQFLIIQEMSPDFYANHKVLNGRTMRDLEGKGVWKSLQFTDPSMQPPDVELMQQAIKQFAHKWASTHGQKINGTLMGLYTQYDFWIRCAVRWLFYKYQNTVKSVNWSAAVKRYNGSGPRAENYQKAVFARILTASNQTVHVGDT